MNNMLITTAISYTNGSPHIGHLYESILSDFIKNLYIITGQNTKLLTGTDEHGKKIEDTAKKMNISSKELCDKYSNEFKELNNKLGTKYDHFIRTTDILHKNLVQESLEKAFKKNDIYLDKYKGWYNIREETFVPELECKETDYKDPITGNPYELIEEETYYFRLSKYKNKIKEYIIKLNVSEHIINDLLVKIEDLRDLSISRTSFNWGIKFPFNDKHIVYVWFDALLNYITGNKILFNDNKTDIIHVIGKDIVWFHTVIYPAILFSLELEHYITPNIYIHGFIMDKYGIKMSKSLGNVVDVNYIIKKYNIEAIKYYLLSNTSVGEDIKFSEEQLVAQYNNELIKSFGNLFQRLYKLLIPVQDDINTKLNMKKHYIIQNNTNIKELINEVIKEKIDIKKYVKIVLDKLGFINKWIQDDKPWEKVDNEKVELLTNMYIDLYQILLLIYPIIPNKIDELREYIGLEKINNKTIDNTDIFININKSSIKAFDIIKLIN